MAGDENDRTEIAERYRKIAQGFTEKKGLEIWQRISETETFSDDYQRLVMDSLKDELPDEKLRKFKPEQIREMLGDLFILTVTFYTIWGEGFQNKKPLTLPWPYFIPRGPTMWWEMGGY